ncbi:carbohydrate kinase [Planktothrix sp. FACHB-1355]|uniref:Carbohydrate kinase n=1 Tax=Aerosakkonema funiforme FACHB-1375 TaxID=2949571 RepID=A0A926VAU4_9CYAN|nr:PfkB family carbohydrate kinase [Aerosakkonema funiforme]MBD2180454.1 carbohydrate kinase [Aerosakkonema funiforme FACHB-1375]MBD3561812.1 carbohydrate kinase [Planktothrix sp. FACHB-1355]
MSQIRVLCLGEILFDCLADRAGRALDEVESWTPYPGGAPANVACGLVKLGTKSGFIGCVGEDEPGNALVQLLQNVGVDVAGVQRHPTAPTRQVYVLRSQTGDRSFAGFGNYNTTEFADTRLQAADLPVKLLEEAEFLVLGTLELAYPQSRVAISQALHIAEQHFVKILVDINWRPVFWPHPDLAPHVIQDLLKRVDFLKLSEEEAEWLFGTIDPGAIAHKLNHCEGVLVTAGEKGCAYYLAENQGELPAFSVDVVDTTGAGDSFVAGFVHQLCQHGIKSLSDADTAKRIVTYATAVGALTATKPGAIAAQPTAAEVEDFLRSHQNLSL